MVAKDIFDISSSKSLEPGKALAINNKSDLKKKKKVKKKLQEKKKKK